MGAPISYRWHDGALLPLEGGDPRPSTLTAADSWLVEDGRVLALELHRDRFFAAAEDHDDLGPFWDAVVALLPREGAWFPRVERQRPSGLLVYREREAPDRPPSVIVATAPSDPRRQPSVKGPDLERLQELRSTVQSSGADEAVILSPDGYVVEGTSSAIVWWRGDLLMAAPEELPRVDSVTERALLGLASALGIETHREAVTPAELDGCEVWALSALHGPRMITRWLDGPELAELPGRLALWRRRLAILRRPL
jgi:branched-subunit amino acid aminotransferase/4-amino-4-deoxychorismate lyase